MTTCIIHTNKTHWFHIMQMRKGRSSKKHREIYPDEDEHFRVSDAVLSLGDADHWELRRARADLHQIADL